MNHSMFGRTTLVFSALILCAGTAFSASFSVLIRQLPPIAGIQCDDFAYAEGQRLREYIGPTISVTDARCHKEPTPGQIPAWNVIITYEAAAKIESVSTYDENAIEQPGFATRAGCEQALKEESARFTRLTKLPIFSAYCNVPSYPEDPWVLTVLAFGKTEVQSYTASVTLFGDIVGHSGASFVSMLKQGFAKVGAELGQANITGKLAYSTLALNYYGKQRIRLSNHRIATFATKETCLSEVASATTALADAGVTSFGVSCHAVYTNEIELSTIRDRGTKLTLSESETLFDTNELCQQQKAAIVAHYRNNLHRDIKAGYCSAPRYADRAKDKNKYHVVMIEKR